MGKFKLTLILSLFYLASCSSTKADKSPFIDLSTLVPDANYDIRYYGKNNFVGTQINGYLAPKCLIHKDAAQALVAVNNELQQNGMRLKIFDCYRPKKAVAHFMSWVKDKNDTSTKAAYYPNLPKQELVGDYIAETSGHSRGYTIDLSIEKLVDGKYQELDMGSPFDMFDTLSNTDDPRIGKEQKK
ncbi:MAG: M15 family metallopeptidase, partial [Gammaproteobacteria bacterium]|nr:M15 family metallopeptidase [Gammaproteobacteria bacterium]